MPADGPPPRRARLRRLDHERRRRAAVGRRAAVVGAVDRARARAALHRLRGRRRRAPPTSCASRSRASRDTPRSRARATTSAACTSASTTCARPTGTRRPSSATCARRSAFLRERCDRVLACTIPLDLGRPRAGARGRARPTRRSSARPRAGALVLRPARLRRAQPGDGRRTSTRPRSARSRSPSARSTCSPRTGWPCACARTTLIALRDDALAPPARRRHLRLPAAQAGGADRRGACAGGAARGLGLGARQLAVHPAPTSGLSSRSSGGSTGAFCQATGRRKRRIAVIPARVRGRRARRDTGRRGARRGDGDAGREAVVDAAAGAPRAARRTRRAARRRPGEATRPAIAGAPVAGSTESREVAGTPCTVPVW